MPAKRTKYQSARKRKSSKSKFRYVILGIVVILIYLFIQGDQGFLKYMKLQQEKRRLLKQIELLRAEYDSLGTEIELLTNNYRYIEKIAREQYQMGKKDEKIIILTPPQK